jgi:hypothetical protein
MGLPRQCRANPQRIYFEMSGNEQTRRNWDDLGPASRQHQITGAGVKRAVGGVMVGSYERERDQIFLRWLENVERLLGRRIARDVAYKAWQDGYSVREYAGERALRSAPPLAPY